MEIDIILVFIYLFVINFFHFWKINGFIRSFNPSLIKQVQIQFAHLQ